MRQVYGLEVSSGEIVEVLHRIRHHVQPLLDSLIALQFVRNDHTRRVLQFLKQLAKKSFGGLFVPSALNQDVKHVSISIDRSPERVLLTTNGENHLIQMPFVSTAWTAVAQFIGVDLPKLQTPLSNRFIAHAHSSLCAIHSSTGLKTERKAEIQLDRVADDFRWKAEPL